MRGLTLPHYRKTVTRFWNSIRMESTAAVMAVWAAEAAWQPADCMLFPSMKKVLLRLTGKNVSDADFVSKHARSI